MKKTLFSLLILAGLAAGARAEDYRPQVDQDVIVSSITHGSRVIAQSFVAVASNTMTGSWYIEVQNLSNEQICCAFDSAAVTTVSSAKSCLRIDTAPTASASGFINWKRWKRWSQNLVLYCRSLKSAGTAEIIIEQGK